MLNPNVEGMHKAHGCCNRRRNHKLGAWLRLFQVVRYLQVQVAGQEALQVYVCVWAVTKTVGRGYSRRY